ncbi:MAG: DUF3343 domain-containing protein [Halanaerobium sp.]
MELNKEIGLNKKEEAKLILFKSTHHSIKAERIFSNKQYDYRMAAVPPEISSDCGSAITVRSELKELINLFEENNILVEAIYQFRQNKNKKEYKKIYSSD